MTFIFASVTAVLCTYKFVHHQADACEKLSSGFSLLKQEEQKAPAPLPGTLRLPPVGLNSQLLTCCNAHPGGPIRVLGVEEGLAQP